MSNKKRVLVAMSGGVDSSVAAVKLIEAGYDVIGVTMQVWDYTSCSIEEGKGTCCSSVDVDDARAVADKYNFPFYVLNCEAKFKEKVITPFINSYLKGETPLPCADCNTFLKFDHLIQKMNDLNCDYLATGHYAQLVQEEGKSFVKTSADTWKDQTYFLFTLPSTIIPKLLFPIGDMTKPDVRKYAEKMGISVAQKKDSVGICFIDSKGYSAFVEKQVSPDKLPASGQLRLFPSGEVLGEHQGIHNFTYGQRKRLGVSHPVPLYVVKIDAQEREVWVGDKSYLYSMNMYITDCHWLGPVQDEESLDIKIRYSHKAAEGKIFSTKNPNVIRVEFEEPQRAVTPGQAAVFYREKKLLGGGWIINEKH